MTIQQRDTLEVQRYLDLLYPDAPPDAWLMVSWIAANGQWCSRWFRLDQREDAAAFIIQTQSYNVYTGIGVRHPDCTPAADKRAPAPAGCGCNAGSARRAVSRHRRTYPPWSWAGLSTDPPVDGRYKCGSLHF
jgi:hypothetical protein